jgi:hypothetical protein
MTANTYKNYVSKKYNPSSPTIGQIHIRALIIISVQLIEDTYFSLIRNIILEAYFKLDNIEQFIGRYHRSIASK